MLISHGLRAASFKPSAGSPYFVAAATTTSSSASSHTVNIPSGSLAGDLLVMFINVRSNSAAAITTPSGWTTFLANATSPIAGAFYKVSSGSEPATITVALGGTVELNAIVMDIRDYSSINTVGAWAASDILNPISNAGITPTASGLLLAYWAIRATSGVTVTFTADPSGMTSASKIAQPGLAAAAYYQDWSATTTGTRSISTSGSLDGTHSLLIQIA